MLRGLIKFGAALVIALAVAYPISHELSARTAIQHGLINTLDANDAAALKQWPGGAQSFIEMLHDRCMRAHGGDTDACTRYRVASE
jgi:hypothetical protein